jgi:hypothetical protein
MTLNKLQTWVNDDVLDTFFHLLHDKSVKEGTGKIWNWRRLCINPEANYRGIDVSFYYLIILSFI